MKSTSLVANSVISLLGLLLPLLVSLLYIPLMVTSMGAARYGLYSLVGTIIAYLGFLEFGIGRAAAKYAAEKSMKLKESALVSQALTLSSGFGLLGTLIVLVASPFLAHLAGSAEPAIRREFLYSLLMLSLIVPLNFVESLFRSLLEIKDEFFLLNLIRIGLALVTAGLTYAFARQGFTAIDDFILIFLVLKIISVVLHYGLWRRRSDVVWAWGWHPDMVKLLLVFGGWSSVSMVVGPIMVNFDRFWIAYYFSAAQVTYYAVPFDIITKLWLVPAAINSVLFPGLARLGLERMERVDLLVRRAALMVSLLVLPAVLLCVFAAHDLLSWWVSPDFAGHSALVMAVLSLGVLINAPSQMVMAGLHAMGNTRAPALLHLMEMPCYLLALALLSMHFGLVGVAFAWLLRATIDAMVLGLVFARSLSGNNKIIFSLLRICGTAGLLLLLSQLLGSTADRWLGLGGFLVTGVLVTILTWRIYQEERRAPAPV